MKAILIRVAVDASYGKWNAPVDPDSGKCVHIPIPKNERTAFHPGRGPPHSVQASFACPVHPRSARDHLPARVIMAYPVRNRPVVVVGGESDARAG